MIDIVPGGDAIVNSVDIFPDFEVAVQDAPERLCAGRWAVLWSERVVDLDRGKNVFPGQREEGSADEGACSQGGECFVVLGEAVDDELVDLESHVRHNKLDEGTDEV